MKKEKTCCLCGCVIEGFENNPWPVKQTETFNGTIYFTDEFMASEDYVCCDYCNSAEVIPARLANIYKKIV